jgi:hypothetical protein
VNTSHLRLVPRHPHRWRGASEARKQREASEQTDLNKALDLLHKGLYRVVDGDPYYPEFCIGCGVECIDTSSGIKTVHKDECPAIGLLRKHGRLP